MQQEQNGALEKKTRDLPVILRRERGQHGWTQADVAQRIGSDAKTVGRWERGVTFPSPYMCQRLSELYGKSISELHLVRDEGQAPVDTSDISVGESIPAPVQDAEQASSESPIANENGQKPTVLPALEAIPLLIPQQRKPDRRVFFYLSSLMLLLLLIVIGMRWPFYSSTPPSSVVHRPGNPYTPTGKLVLNETLATNSAAGWSLNQNDQGKCFFAGGQYRIRDVQIGAMEVCLANETYFTNFTYEIQMMIEAGDCGGLAFRTTFPQLYYFLSCADGRYRFVRYDKDNPAKIRIVASGLSPAIHQGYNTTNLLAVVAVGDSFRLYINHLLVVSDTDDAYLDGQVGTIAHTCRNSKANLCDAPTEVSFSDARVWQM